MISKPFTARFKVCIVAAVVVTLWYIRLLPPVGPGWSLYTSKHLPRDAAANATLGFQKILAVSSGPSWRTRGLQAAAKHTNLEVSIPNQPYNSEEVVQAFMTLGGSDIQHPNHGSATAWIAHLDMLKYVVANDLSSAFIVEDDIDWDTSIHAQMSLVSDNVRNFSRVGVSDPTPFGRAWDVLWLGHCGEVTESKTKRLEYADADRMPTELYAGWSKKWLSNILEGHRVVQMAHMPVCSFGYGVTRKSAQKLLKLLSHGEGKAFDIALERQCTKGNLRCVTVNPEIMHHYNPPNGWGQVNAVSKGNARGSLSEDENFEFAKGTTANMVHSARCEVLFGETCPQAPWSPQPNQR